MNKKNNLGNFRTEISLVVLLLVLTSVSLFGYKSYQRRVNETAQMIMINQEKTEHSEGEESNKRVIPIGMESYISHRGLNTLYPEGTALAFTEASHNGFKEWEADIWTTSDGIPIISHDNEINELARQSDGSELEAPVKVTETNLETLLTYDFGIHKGLEFSGTSLLTLEELLDLAVTNDVSFLHLELKGKPNFEKIKRIFKLAEERDLLDNIGWQSHHLEDLKKVKELDPLARLEWLTATFSEEESSQLAEENLSPDQVTISMPHYVEDSAVLLAKEKGHQVYIFTIVESNIEYISKFVTLGVDAFMTDLSMEVLPIIE